MKSPFQILDVAQDADDETIKKAYLQKVKAHPPSRDPENFQQIREAYELIETKKKRIDYQLFNQPMPTVEDLLPHLLANMGEPQRPTEDLLKTTLAESLNDYQFK